MFRHWITHQVQPRWGPAVVSNAPKTNTPPAVPTKTANRVTAASTPGRQQGRQTTCRIYFPGPCRRAQCWPHEACRSPGRRRRRGDVRRRSGLRVRCLLFALRVSRSTAGCTIRTR
ncbi:uncharacterized protein CC84DRAFT_795868 [Paraphaeosphaeria sporulosa]|uniref:Uncharacterized protein n=1 Tax=Paraphaeosphaeria sporulosa TaxID=1460663 RepID=A0A177C9Z2_9PLEO|nr:uncharacterized protein CC84DRAFT_795868 [Paraphaeosphaeria sporulosa]OAG04564.1 hypothetical protein CC84DRAFT_795868 [Paraphaeosphaeria sporulosa]